MVVGNEEFFSTAMGALQQRSFADFLHCTEREAGLFEARKAKGTEETIKLFRGPGKTTLYSSFSSQI